MVEIHTHIMIGMNIHPQATVTATDQPQQDCGFVTVCLSSKCQFRAGNRDYFFGIAGVSQLLSKSATGLEWHRRSPNSESRGLVTKAR